jgi:hypothetical protein
MHNPIVFAWRETNITVVAGPGGTLDGQGAAWWSCANMKGPGNDQLGRGGAVILAEILLRQPHFTNPLTQSLYLGRRRIFKQHCPGLHAGNMTLPPCSGRG